jgi:tRNA nucleotidyltransferase (CCA-adding enzyme)
MTQAVVAGQAANTPAALLAYIQKTQQTKDGQSL